MLDWLLSLFAASVLCLAAGIVLLLASNLNRRDPPDWAVYVAATIISTWLPGWLLYTALAWSGGGATIGMARMHLTVVNRRGVKPGAWRAALRALALTWFSTPLLATPAAVAVTVSLGGAIGVWIAVPAAALALLSAAACGAAFFGKEGKAWHDYVSGTRVVSKVGDSQSSSW